MQTSIKNRSIRFLLESSLDKKYLKLKEIVSSKSPCLQSPCSQSNDLETNNINDFKWDFSEVNTEYFQKIERLVEKSIMGNYLKSVLVNVSSPDVLIFDPIDIPEKNKQYFFKEKELMVYIADF